MKTPKFRTFMIYLLFWIMVYTDVIHGIIINDVSFDIKRSICLTSEKFQCESICGKVEQNVMKISVIPTTDEVTLCDIKHIPQYLRYSNFEKTRDKILYQISIEEGTVIRDLVYARMLAKEELGRQIKENSTSDVSEVIIEDTISTEEYIQQLLGYLDIIDRLVNSPLNEQTVFIYQVNEPYKLKGSRVVTPHQEYPNVFDINLNLTARFFSSFKTNVEFIAGVKRIDINMFHAWMELEERIQKFIRDMQKYDATFRKSLTVIDLFAAEETSTLLMKQIVLDNSTIIFAIPRHPNVKPIENTKPWCITVCAQNGWFLESQLIVCCDPNEYMKYEETSTITNLLHAIPNLTYRPLPVYVKGGKVMLLFEEDLLSELKGNLHFFCNDYDKLSIKGETKQINVLKEVEKEERCKYPLTDTVVKIPGRYASNGFIIDLALEHKKGISLTKFRWSSKNKPEKYEPILKTETANNEELEYNNVNADYNFGQRIFKNNTTLWYIMLSTFVFNEKYGIEPWKYLMFPMTPSVRNERMGVLQSFPLGSVTCIVSSNSRSTVNMLYTKENVIEQFIKSIGPVNEELKETYLQYLWDKRYVLPIPYLSHLNMTFINHESFSSCNVLPMWTEIYNKYWSAVLRMTHKVSREKKQVNIYETQYQLLKFKDSGEKFVLYKDNKMEGMYFYRYIIKILITQTAQIAFVTVNDIFLLMDEAETPFNFDDTFLTTYCKLNCIDYGYEDLTINDIIINYCCEVTKQFLKEVTGSSVKASYEYAIHKRILRFPPEYNY